MCRIRGQFRHSSRRRRTGRRGAQSGYGRRGAVGRRRRRRAGSATDGRRAPAAAASAAARHAPVRRRDVGRRRRALVGRALVVGRHVLVDQVDDAGVRLLVDGDDARRRRARVGRLHALRLRAVLGVRHRRFRTTEVRDLSPACTRRRQLFRRVAHRLRPGQETRQEFCQTRHTCSQNAALLNMLCTYKLSLHEQHTEHINKTNGSYCVRAGRHTVSYWSTHGSDDSVAGYQATAATTEELTADCYDRQRQSSS